MIFALFGGLVGCLAFVIVVVTVIGLLVKKQQADTTAGEIAGGSTSGLEDWTGSTLGELSRNVVGDWYYQRPMGGRLVSRMTGALHSCRTRGEAVRFSCEKRNEGGELTVLTNWTRLDIRLSPSSCQIWVNRTELGSLGLGSGRISDPRGGELGAYQRGPDAARLLLRGRDVAWVRRATEPESALPPLPEPFCASLAPVIDEEATLWLVALMAIEAGNFAMPAAERLIPA